MPVVACHRRGAPRRCAFPAWLGVVAAAAAVAEALLWCGTVVSSGPLASNGWLTYVLYPALLAWLLPSSVMMIRQHGAGPSR